MTFWRSIDGLVDVELTAAEPEKALTAITLSGIGLFEVRHDKNLVCSFSILRRDYARLAALCEKQGLSLKTNRRLMKRHAS